MDALISYFANINQNFKSKIPFLICKNLNNFGDPNVGFFLVIFFFFNLLQCSSIWLKNVLKS